MNYLLEIKKLLLENKVLPTDQMIAGATGSLEIKKTHSTGEFLTLMRVMMDMMVDTEEDDEYLGNIIEAHPVINDWAKIVFERLEAKTKEIRFPIFQDDTLYDLIHVFLTELHEKKWIYISNNTEGDIITASIEKILEDKKVKK